MMLKPFKQIPIFDGLNSDQIALLELIFSIVDCGEGDVIFEQGSGAEFLFIVVTGEVAIIFNPDDGEPIDVTKVSNGGVFGWSAAFGTGTYTSGAVCRSDSELLKVTGDDLKTLRQNHPETGILILERLAEVVAQRLECSTTHNQVVALLEHALKNGIRPIGG